MRLMRRFAFLEPLVIGPLLMLTGFSVIVLRSVVPEEAGQQLLFVVAGFIVFGVVSQTDYRMLRSLASPLYILALTLLAATIIFGQVTRGSVRWIEIGSVTIQPSELIKPVMILFLSNLAGSRSLKNPANLFVYSALAALPILLVFIEPDLGSSLVLSVIAVAIAFIAGASLKALAATGILGAGVLPLIFRFLKPYQQDRLRAFVDPFSDPLGSGYHVIQAMIAVGSGKLFGRGLGHGTQSQLRFLPERHSDFIFASLAEELGFIGAIMVLGSYAVLTAMLLRSIGHEEHADSVGTHILVGVLAMLLFQVVVNVGMNMGILPITGITLPLVSSGGSSMIATMASLGLAQSVVARRGRRRTIEIR